MKYLIAIAIGPVQDFIASARRTRDLWFGSWLLSEISKAAAREIQSQNGKLVFPSPGNPNEALEADSTFNVVNKLLAQIESDNIHNLLDKKIFPAMSTRLEKISKEAFDDLRARKAQIHWNNAEAQIKDLIEFYWAAYPFEDSKSYESVRRKTESLLAARKATRNFNQVTWGGNVPKSSFDGLRESVIDESVFDRLDGSNLNEKQKAYIQKELRLVYKVRGKERLCGVSLLKRHGKPHKNAQGIDSFFSTSHVAALPLLNRLKEKKAVDDYLRELTNILGIIDDREIKTYFGHVPNGAALKPHQYFCNNDGSLLYDGHLLFKERLRDFFPEDDDCKKAEKALKRFLESAFHKEEYPHPYYAILHADGDRMGEVIDHQTEVDDGFQKHKGLSGSLSEFAGKVKEIVEKDHDGSCVYAGGDDVLALLPLHTALKCARELAKDFFEKLKGFENKDGKTPTLSVGIAVGHHLDPLQDTLSLAREAEKIAKKQVKDKNALAVIVSKRSGAERAVKGSWEASSPGGSLYQRLNRFIFLHLKDELPDGAAYELRDLTIRLKPPQDATEKQKEDATEKQKENLLEAQRVESKRILKRKRSNRGKKDLSDEVIKYLYRLIDGKGISLEELADEIIVAREFAKAVEQAGIDPDEFAKDNGISDAISTESEKMEEEK